MDGSTRHFPVLDVIDTVASRLAGVTARADSRSMAPLPVRDLTRPCFDADVAVVRDWLGSLRSAGVRQSGPALILALEGLRRAAVSPVRRCSILHLLKLPVLKTCAGLPKPWSGPGQPADTGAAGVPQRGVTLEQRLYRLMFQNLYQALIELDRGGSGADDRQARWCHWVLRNLFRFCGRQLRYAALWDCPLPVNTWRELHDLYVYLMVRRVTRVAVARPPDRMPRGVDASIEYKQLLLFGLAVQRAERAVRDSAVMAGLDRWAAATLLEDPHQGLQGQRGLYVVEIAQDQPPRRHPGPLDLEFRGWVLLPPTEFFEQLEHGAPGHAAAPSPPSPPRPQARCRPRVAAMAGCMAARVVSRFSRDRGDDSRPG